MSGRLKHKSGPLKQKNKAHKSGRHKTKGELNADHKGRVSLKAQRGRNAKEVRKADRKNKQNQLRAAKRAEVLQRKREFSGSGSPHLVVVLPLSPHVDLDAVRSVFCQACGHDCHTHSDASTVTTLVDSAHKGRFSLVIPPTDDLYRMLDLAKVADSLVFIHRIGVVMDEFYTTLVDCCLAQGLPTAWHLLQFCVHCHSTTSRTNKCGSFHRPSSTP